MSLNLGHPFLEPISLDNMHHDKIKEVEDMHKWIQEQHRFPKYTKEHAYLFLHACHWDIPATRKALQKYAQIRAGAPDIFDDRDPLHPEMQFVYEMTHMVKTPIKTREGYKILFYRLADTDPSKVHFGNAIKAFCMYNDVQISVDGIVEGYVVVFDMKGLRLGHLTKLQLGPLRTFMAYIQEAHPVRLKKIIVVHTASFINQIMAIIKPLIKSELLDLLQFTPKGPSDVFPLALLPEDYGGPLDTLEKYHMEQRKQIENDYREWLIESSVFKEMPKDKASKENSSKKIKTVKPPVNSFNALEID